MNHKDTRHSQQLKSVCSHSSLSLNQQSLTNCFKSFTFQTKSPTYENQAKKLHPFLSPSPNEYLPDRIFRIIWQPLHLQGPPPYLQYILDDMMNNSTLVNNTDRIYGEQDPLKKSSGRNQYVDTESEIVIWLKLICLILGTYGLIVGLYVLSGVIIRNSGGTESFEEGGGIIFGIFIVYMVIVGIAWYKGSSKREFMKREAVEEELRREREADMVLQ